MTKAVTYEGLTIEPIFNSEVTQFVYASSYLTINPGCGLKFTAPQGKTITKVDFGNKRAAYNNGITPALTGGKIWEGSEQSVTFMAGTDANNEFGIAYSISVTLEGDDIAPSPVITIDPEGTLPLGEAPIVKSVTVKGANLEGDITITCPQYVTADKATITKAEAEAEDGCVVTFTINPPASIDMARYEIKFESEKAQPVTLAFSGKVVVVPTYTKLADIKADQTFYYDGEVLVTYVDKASKSFFVEADGQAWRIFTTYADKFDIDRIAEGDMIKKFKAETYTSIAQRTMYLQNNKGGNIDGGVTRVSRENEVTPKTITLAELEENYADSYNMLVKLEKLSVPEAEGKTIAATSEAAADGLTVKQGEATLEKVLGAFAESDAVGEAAPEGEFDLVGIRMWTSGVLARTKADITPFVEVVPPTVTLSQTSVELTAVEGKEATDKVTLTMDNCTAPVVITAKNEANAITLSTMSIEPSAEPVEITITFAPTQEGVVEQQFEITTEGLEAPVVLTVKGLGTSMIEMVAAEADGMYRVYSVNGVKVMETSNAEDLNALASGIYVINGRKYMINK